MHVRAASMSEASDLVTLINAAFRVEKFFVESDRITLEEVQALFRKGSFLVAEENGLAACVYVERRGGRGYFGLLSVDPARQKNGVGRKLVDASEQFCRELGCDAMDLQIVNLREELPAFYRRLGYQESGTAPWPEEVATKIPCHFVRMSKAL